MQTQNKMLTRSAVVILLIISLFIVITVMLTKGIVKLVYTDTLTGAGNTTAYRECTDGINKQIISGNNVKFAVAVIDINDLKKTNDGYGHEYGDRLIQSAATVLKKVWNNNVYRIGGDEFAIVMMNEDDEKVTKEVLRLEEELSILKKQSSTEELWLQLAVGTAVYNPETDGEYADVFRRADGAMYKDKKLKKANHDSNLPFLHPFSDKSMM